MRFRPFGSQVPGIVRRQVGIGRSDLRRRRVVGIIGFDDCRSEHDWLAAEIDIIEILAELVGAAIVSLRRLQVLADANRIVEESRPSSIGWDRSNRIL